MSYPAADFGVTGPEEADRYKLSYVQREDTIALGGFDCCFGPPTEVITVNRDITRKTGLVKAAREGDIHTLQQQV